MTIGDMWDVSSGDKEVSCVMVYSSCVNYILGSTVVGSRFWILLVLDVKVGDGDIWYTISMLCWILLLSDNWFSLDCDG